MSNEAYHKLVTGFVSRSGDTVDTQIRLVGDPTDPVEAATKKYADDNIVATIGIVRPVIVGRYYMPTFGRLVQTTFATQNGGHASPLFVGGTATWDRIMVTTQTDGVGSYQLAILELDATLFPRNDSGSFGYLYTSSITAVPLNGDGFVEETIDVTTTADWIAVAAWRNSALKTFNFLQGNLTNYRAYGIATGVLRTGGGSDGLVTTATSTLGMGDGLGQLNTNDWGITPSTGTQCPRTALRLKSRP